MKIRVIFYLNLNYNIPEFRLFKLADEGTPSSLDFVSNDKSRLITSFGETHHNLYDVETSKIISRFDYYESTLSIKF